MNCDDISRFADYGQEIETVQFWAECKAEQDYENAQCAVKDGELWQ